MTTIDFYTHVDDKLKTACRLAAKAHASGKRVLLACPDAELARALDRLLWTSPATGFIPHCSPLDRLAAVTPVHVDHTDAEPLHDDVLINLRAEWPPHFTRFQRLIEIVSTEEGDRQAARGRYKFYRDRGYPIRSHDLSQPA